MTPVEEIRRAAALMREQHGPILSVFWAALADWLDEETKEHPDDDDFRYVQPGCKHALAVARAYLDGERP